METKRMCVPDLEEIIGLYFPVLDHGFVSVVDYMGGDLAVERAARCSYSVAQEVRDIKDTRHLLRYMARHQHNTPFEMASITLHVGLPIVSMRQLIRHRTLSVNEYSGRYSVMPLMFYTPTRERLSKQSKTNKQGSGERVAGSDYDRFMRRSSVTRSHVKSDYRTYLECDIAKELARIDLPLSTYTYCYIEVDVRNFFHLIGLRSDGHAQEEIRAYSDVFAGIAQRFVPISFSAFEDYQLYATKFSQAEMAAIRVLGHYHVSPIMWSNFPRDIRKIVNDVLADHGVPYTPSGKESREQGEFWQKMAPKTRKDFALNINDAKNGRYFMSMIQEYAVEVPDAA